MSFFKFNNEIKTEDLKLSDYNQIWTKFCFLDVTVPKHIRFEVDVKKEVNKSMKRLALAGVCRIDSRANDLL